MLKMSHETLGLEGKDHNPLATTRMVFGNRYEFSG